MRLTAALWFSISFCLSFTLVAGQATAQLADKTETKTPLAGINKSFAEQANPLRISIRAPNFPQNSHGGIKLTVLFNDPAELE